MSPITIREVRSSDAGGLARAWEDGRAYYAALDPVAFNAPDPGDTGLGAWLVDDLLEAEANGGRARVAALDGDAVGFVSARVDPPVASAHRQLIADLGSPRGAIDSLAVQRAHWRAGIGRRLVGDVETWARGRGARLVHLTTYAASPVSVPFYAALGYERRSVVFLKYLA